jgi:hypothetical protein
MSQIIEILVVWGIYKAESKGTNATPSTKVEVTGDEFVDAASALTEELPFT